MFSVDDIVKHKKTGKVGKIIGYGCQTDGNTYFSTFKVQIFKKKNHEKLIIEDNLNAWSSCRKVTQTLPQNSPSHCIAA